MINITKAILNVIESIQPFDDLEALHVQDASNWIRTTTDSIFRISKPDKPPKHLVSYFVVVDEARHSILLIDHIKSGLWLPAGGHVEIDESPAVTVAREAQEELGLDAKFSALTGDQPLMITVTQTVNGNIHTDVSLWYVLTGDSRVDLDFDRREMKGYKWFTFDEILKTNIDTLDPHMHRFVNKLQQLLEC
jgi:8-oxo-dGTP pyrophosphatase MutT (NUDIX family)